MTNHRSCQIQTSDTMNSPISHFPLQILEKKHSRTKYTLLESETNNKSDFKGNLKLNQLFHNHCSATPSSIWTDCINGGQKKYSFVFVLIRLTSLVIKDKVQKKCSFRTRLVGLISTKTKECFFGRHLCMRSIITQNVKLHTAFS